MYATLPIPSDFKETDSSFQLKAELGLVPKYFKASMPFDNVKEFYIQRLTPGGWTLVKERRMTDWFRNFGGRELTFRKEQNSLVIEYAGERADNQWDYAIGLEWKSSP
jgi:hypothetical protein